MHVFKHVVGNGFASRFEIDGILVLFLVLRADASNVAMSNPKRNSNVCFGGG